MASGRPASGLVFCMNLTISNWFALCVVGCGRRDMDGILAGKRRVFSSFRGS